MERAKEAPNPLGPQDPKWHPMSVHTQSDIKAASNFNKMRLAHQFEETYSRENQRQDLHYFKYRT